MLVCDKNKEHINIVRIQIGPDPLINDGDYFDPRTDKLVKVESCHFDLCLECLMETEFNVLRKANSITFTRTYK